MKRILQNINYTVKCHYSAKHLFILVLLITLTTLILYDFIKIVAPGVNSAEWYNNTHLLFPLPVNEKTGEVIKEARKANYKNLQFKITPSTILEKGDVCTVSGSFHKYLNEGIHNKNDFYLYEFIEICNELEQKFNLKSTAVEVKNFEYGVNILLPPGIYAKDIIDNIVCLPTRRFASLNMERVKFGKIASFDDHDIKIYDKGEQDWHPELDQQKPQIIRIELRVKKMRFLENRNIKDKTKPLSLYDMQQTPFVLKLGEILAAMFAEVIFYDKNIQIEHLTHKQQLAITQFQNPLFWENLSHKQRYKQRERFNRLMFKCETSDKKENIKNAIIDKVKVQALTQKDVQTSPKLNINKNIKKATFTPFKCRVQTPPFEMPFSLFEKTAPKKRFCLSCGKDISHQRKHSRFCSARYVGEKAAKQCRNNYTNPKRKSRFQQLKEIEQQHLTAFNKKSEFKIIVGIKKDNRIINKRLTKESIKTRNVKLQKVVKIKIYGNSSPFQVTTRNAKKLFKELIS